MASIREVAQAAGVSVGSVSRYLNGQKLKEANMEKIAQAIQELDYKENLIAKGLKNNRSFSIGLLMRHFSSRLSTEIIASIEAVMEEKGYSLLLSGFEGNPKLIGKKIDSLLTHAIDGLIIFEADEEWAEMKQLADIPIPVISLNSPNASANIDSILVDDRSSVQKTMTKMIEEGHRSIGVIAGPQTDYTARERLEGALASAASLVSTEVYTGDYSRLSGYEGAKELLAKGVTSLVVCNYNMSIGVLEYLNQANIQIGKDIAYAHYDYFEERPLILDSRITIQQPAQAIGRCCGERMIERIEGRNTETGITILFENKISGI